MNKSMSFIVFHPWVTFVWHSDPFPEPRWEGIQQTTEERKPKYRWTRLGNVFLNLSTCCFSPTFCLKDYTENNVLLQEVHQHMNVVFKELLVRQQQQDQVSSTSVPPSTLSSSSGSPQPINKKGTTSQKAKGSFKPTEQMNWEMRGINPGTHWAWVEETFTRGQLLNTKKRT